VRVFFAGASGVIGRTLLPRLVEEGHEVAALTRSPDKAKALREAGAEPVVADALDADALAAAVSVARPEGVINHLTDLPQRMTPGAIKEGMARTDRMRTAGTANLIEAARAAGARRIVAQSIAFAYPPGGSGLRDETDPLFLQGPAPFDDTVGAATELERAVTNAEGLEGVALRFGFWYGPGTAYASDGHLANEARRRRLPVVGGGSAVWSFVHVDDVAGATIAALDKGEPGIYNVVDDDPAPTREWVPAFAEAVGAKRPFRMPTFLARLVAGRYVAYVFTEIQGASNEKAKRDLGWSPRWPSWRQGFREALG
jgi:nucleoside-diphosphate-sugar epimerase